MKCELFNENQMKKFSVRIAWSQTDIDTVLVYANTWREANRKVKEKYKNVQILGTAEIKEIL